MRKFPVGVIALFLGSMSQAQGIVLPPSIPSFGQDEFHASDGTSCRSSMDGARRIEAGAYGISAREAEPYRDNSLSDFTRDPSQNVGVYVRFTMSLDARRTRIDCNRLYELELAKKNLELNMMQQSLKTAEEKIRTLETKSATADTGRPPPL